MRRRDFNASSARLLYPVIPGFRTEGFPGDGVFFAFFDKRMRVKGVP